MAHFTFRPFSGSRLSPRFAARTAWPHLLASLAFVFAWLSPAGALAGHFDDRGNFFADAQAITVVAFDQAPERFVPEDDDPSCKPEGFSIVDAPAEDPALLGSRFLRLDPLSGCAERFVVAMPPLARGYVATLWARHGALSARVHVTYAEGSDSISARMAPTGRTTSDGWVEHATNAFPVDGSRQPLVYVRLGAYAHLEGVDIDALELVPAGPYEAQAACSGVRDPVCGDEGLCIYGRCRLGRLGVPPLPEGELKDAMVDTLAAKLDIFFGGQKTRADDLPVAQATLDQMRDAKTAWAFWNGFGTAVRQLHDWHTNASAAIDTSGPSRRLNVCFIEGEADRTHHIVPQDGSYRDVLVSHVGLTDNEGLRAGDRLVAVDGVHPIAWARSLIDVDWGYQTATDANVFADFAQHLGGPYWLGGASILKYARELTVIRCDGTAGTCAETTETIAVSSISSLWDSADVACDNRPAYHLEEGSNPDPLTHYVFGDFYRGRVASTTPEQAVYGMIWDTLYGGGDPNGWVNTNINTAIDDWKQNARGVILDHRTGNGGTLDAPEYLTRLVRPTQIAAVTLMPMPVAAWDGPIDDLDGVALFEAFKDTVPYTVGASNHDPSLPVALLVHRSGSASDYLPYGMKGAPNVRIFGPGPTQGAFSTFIDFWYYGGLRFSLASGDTIGADGKAAIGRGVVPDEVVALRQSDLMVGVDTIHEAALAWVLEELKP